MRPAICAIFLASLTLAGCADAPTSHVDSATPERLRPEIVATHPGDPTAFTQGLEVDPNNPDQLLVGTGWLGESHVYRRTLAGQKLSSAELQPTEFGEGITQVGDRIWQLTWQNGVAYQRDARTLAVTKEARFPGEGWGLCAQGERLIMSDGTNTLRVLDPDTFAEQGRITTDTVGLNELECTDDAIYANVFLTTDIVRFDTEGRTTALIDASSLPNNAVKNPNHVLNGIAHIPGTDRFYLTGKRWPDIYEVRFVPTS